MIGETKERYSALFHNSNDGIVLHDAAGAILDVNPRALEMFGFSRSEILELNIRDLHEPEALALSRAAFEAVAQEGHFRFEIDFRRKDGTDFPAEVSASQFEVEGVKMIQGIVRDITRRRKAEREIREYTRQIERSSDFRNLFTDILSHDLLNPASIIASVSSLLVERDLAPIRDEVALINRNARRMVELIQTAAEYVQVEALSRLDTKELNLTAMVAGAVDRLKPRFEERGMNVLFRPSGEAHACLNSMIEDAFLNILSNTLKYTPEGSTVVVSLTDEGDSWLFSVVDEGSGIPDEYKESIFKRFHRREKMGVKGAGLGLAIAKRLVDLHGGEIWVEDAPGGGSIFSVRLPRLRREC